MACETKLAGWAKFSELPSVSGAGWGFQQVMTCHEEHFEYFDEGHLFMSKSCVRTTHWLPVFHFWSISISFRVCIFCGQPKNVESWTLFSVCQQRLSILVAWRGATIRPGVIRWCSKWYTFGFCRTAPLCDSWRRGAHSASLGAGLQSSNQYMF